MALCLLRPSLPSRICRTPAAAALAQRHRMMMSDDARCRGRAPALSPLPTSLVRQGVVALSTKPTLPKLEPEDSRKTQLRKRVFFRFMDYLAGYGKNVLDKILPAKAVQYYRWVVLWSGVVCTTCTMQGCNFPFFLFPGSS